MCVKTRKSNTTPERYVHLVVEGHPHITHVTVFARLDATGQWQAAAAYCSKADHFERKRGRNIARRRWFEGAHRWVLGDTFTYDHARKAALFLMPSFR